MEGYGERKFTEDELEPAALTPDECAEEDAWLQRLIPKLPAIERDTLAQALAEQEAENPENRT